MDTESDCTGGLALPAKGRASHVEATESRLRLYNEPVRFEWDPDKAARNLEKHGVSFEDAQTVFDDDLFVVFEDPDHSLHEKRYLIMGQSSEGRLLVVSYTERSRRVRLINARPATRHERKAYEEI